MGQFLRDTSGIGGHTRCQANMFSATIGGLLVSQTSLRQPEMQHACGYGLVDLDQFKAI